MLVQPGDHTKKKMLSPVFCLHESTVDVAWHPLHSGPRSTSAAPEKCCLLNPFIKYSYSFFFSHYLQIRNWLSVCCPRRPISIHLFVWEILLCTFAQEEIPLLRLSFIGLLAVENVKDFLDDCKFCVLYVQLWVVFGVFQNSTDLFLRAKVPLVFHPHLPSSWCRGPVFLYKEEIRLYLDTLYHHKLFMYGLTLTVPL